MGRGSGKRVNVPESWLERCRQWRDDHGYSFQKVGEILAHAISRKQPFGSSTIHRYLSGEAATDELTEAFAKVMEVTPPHALPPFESEEHRLWCELGVRLTSVAPAVFARELQVILRIVQAHENAAMARSLDRLPTDDESS